MGGEEVKGKRIQKTKLWLLWVRIGLNNMLGIGRDKDKEDKPKGPTDDEVDEDDAKLLDDDEVEDEEN